MKNYFYVAIFLLVVSISTIDGRSIPEEDFRLNLLLNNTNQENKYLLTTIASYRHRFEHSPFHKRVQWASLDQSVPFYCELCDLLVPAVRLLIELNQTSEIENLTLKLCHDIRLFLDYDVCVGAVDEYKSSVLDIIPVSKLTSKELCAATLNCGDPSDFPGLRWNISLPGSKPTPKPPKPPTPGSPTLKILHLSDIHIDFAYKPGSQADCTKPICCREGPPQPGHPGAGFWGDYRNCDLPFWTAQAMFEYIAKFEDFDFIYYTGDLPPHNVWNQSREDQLYALKTINQLLATTFPNKTFFSAIGNHEAAPCNLFPTPAVAADNITWLYEPLAESWISLGLPEETRESVVRGAFYTTLVRPGLRLISLNMNYCNGENFWIFINTTDPLDQLKWMVDWLKYAEDHQEKVHIIAHHPPRSCLPMFSWNFHSIVNRFENTITGQFYGHTHNDEFIVYYDDSDEKRPFSMGYITPSLTTQSFLNPGYRVYTLDGDYPASSFWVLDHYTMIMNLTESNISNKTVIIKEYEAKQAYQMENLFPADWDSLIQRMQNDLDGPLMGSAYKFYTKSYSNGTSCDHYCRRALLCNFKTARSQDHHACDSIPTDS